MAITKQPLETAQRLRIVNPNPKYPKPRLLERTTFGYIYFAAKVDPGPIPFVLPSSKRSRLLPRLKKLALDLEVDERLKANVFRAVAIPPTARFNSYLKERKGNLRYANFDVLVLIQARSVANAREVQETAAYRGLLDALRDAASNDVHVMVAHNARRIADVHTTRRDLFLFNHFAADDPKLMLELWEYLAGWYVVETGLTNSVAMVPEPGEDANYAIVNWASWDVSAPLHFWHQLSKRSFWNYVAPNLEQNRAGSMPVYCRLA